MNAGSTDTPASDTPALEIEGLRFAHDAAAGEGAGRWVVGVDRLTLAPGEQLLLTGPSGEGKSTLLHVVAGLLEPQRGSVRIAGQDVHRLRGGRRDRFRGRHIGMIFQSLNLLRGFSAEQNVLLAMRFASAPAGERRRRAHDLLAQLGLDDPEAVVDRLSLGQQQRVAVARAVAAEPALVLADEPTASLDPARAAEAMTLIQQACRDNHAALLCTSHDPAMAQRFSQSVALADLAAQPEAAG